MHFGYSECVQYLTSACSICQIQHKVSILDYEDIALLSINIPIYCQLTTCHECRLSHNLNVLYSIASLSLIHI